MVVFHYCLAFLLNRYFLKLVSGVSTVNHPALQERLHETWGVSLTQLGWCITYNNYLIKPNNSKWGG